MHWQPLSNSKKKNSQLTVLEEKNNAVKGRVHTSFII